MNKAKLCICAALLMLSCSSFAGKNHDHQDLRYQRSGHQKPGAPIYVDMPAHKAVSVNQSVDLEFTFSSAKLGSAELYISADGSLSHDLPAHIGLDFTDGSRTLNATISASEAGRFYLNFQLFMDGKIRSVSYGQTFGDGVSSFKAPSDAPVVDGIKILPATETIRKK